MTNQTTTYILSDAECVLGSYTPPVLPDQPQWHDGYEVENGYEMFQQEMDYWRERCHELKEEAKAKAVKFADQKQVTDILVCDGWQLDSFGRIKPDTIYTVEGYEVDTLARQKSFPTIKCGQCFKYAISKGEPCDTCEIVATLKRIEPVVDKPSIDKIEKRFADCEKLAAQFNGENLLHLLLAATYIGESYATPPKQ